MPLEEITHEEYVAMYQRGDFEFEGYITHIEDGLPVKRYAHVKSVNVDGVKVIIHAEDDEVESYDATSPENVNQYSITIQSYDKGNTGVSFTFPLNDIWTREKIMHEFNTDIIEKVRERVDFNYFKLMYGELSTVIWGRAVEKGKDEELHTEDEPDGLKMTLSKHTNLQVTKDGIDAVAIALVGYVSEDTDLTEVLGTPYGEDRDTTTYEVLSPEEKSRIMVTECLNREINDAYRRFFFDPIPERNIKYVTIAGVAQSEAKVKEKLEEVIAKIGLHGKIKEAKRFNGPVKQVLYEAATYMLANYAKRFQER